MVDAPISDPEAARATSGPETFGYRQELKRSLSAFDLLVYGLVFIVPVAPWSTFGFVFNASHGMVPLVYVVGLVAMLFTALSYAAMAQAFPVAGSVYAYAGRSIGESAGFLAGWALLLDYLLLPALIYVTCAVTMHAVVPFLPKWLLVLAFSFLNTAINLLGIESTARVSILMLILQLLFLVTFVVLALITLAHGAYGSHLTLGPLYSPTKVTPALIFGALSLAVLSFLGFDAISTLTEEARGGARAVGAATLISLVVAAVLFVGQTYLASLVVLDHDSFRPGDDANTAFLLVAKRVGGEPFRWAVSIPGVLFAGITGALTAQAATARLIYSMARDRMLPTPLAHVSAKRQAPDRAILLTTAVTLAVGVAMVNRVQLLTSMVSFGALTGFLALHASVIVHFLLRQRSRDWWRHLAAPVIGLVIIGYVIINVEANAKIAGGAWLTIGLAIVFGLKLSGRRPPPLLKEEF